jgi:general secretion pathway protein L
MPRPTSIRMSTLVITLPLGSPQAPADYTLTVDGHTPPALQRQRRPAARPGPHRRSVAVVPVRALSWQRVTLPRRAGKPRLRAARRPAGAAAGRPRPAALCPAAGRPAGSPSGWPCATAPGCAGPAGAGGRGPPGRSRGAGVRSRPTASGREECEVLGQPEDAYAVLTGHGAQQAVAMLPLAGRQGALHPGTGR